MSACPMTAATVLASSIPLYRREEPSGPRLRLYGPGDEGREAIEQYIQARYRQRFGAVIHDWLPTLVSLEHHGEIVAAAGYRSAQLPLYLERYLPRPIETYLLDAEVPAHRALIVETGQFASDRAGGRFLVPMLARHLSQAGFHWAVSTLTGELAELFHRMGLSPLTLADADPACLQASERADWGTYYTHHPRVVAERLLSVVRQLRKS